jgi:hypothetical protein
MGPHPLSSRGVTAAGDLACPTHDSTDGRIKLDLQWAVAYPEKQLHIHFETDTDPIDIHLDRTEELGDGTSFGLTGHVVSTNHKDKRFKRFKRIITSAAGMV